MPNEKIWTESQSALDIDVAAYHREGVLCIRQLCSPEWVAVLRRAAESVLAEPSPFRVEFSASPERGSFIQDTFVWQRNEDVRRFIFRSPTAKVAAALLGTSTIRLFFDHVLVKEPGTLASTPWHQDLPYWPVSGGELCSIWIALDHVAVESGGVTYLRGSHRWARDIVAVSFRERGAAGDVLSDIDPALISDAAVCWSLQPGDAVVHHPRTIHGAGGNRGTSRRRAFVTRWFNDNVLYEPRTTVPLLIPDPGLLSGSKLQGDLFPVAWRAADIK